jgi:ribosomal protein L17
MAARKTPSRGGKPDKLWTDALRIVVNEVAEDGDKKKLRRMAEKIVDLALAGDMQAIKEIGDRLEGKPTQRVEATGEDGGPIEYADMTTKELARQILAMIEKAKRGDDD